MLLQVFRAIWNNLSPCCDFPCDDDSRVMHNGKSVSKFGLLLVQGSAWDGKMNQLPFTITRSGTKVQMDNGYKAAYDAGPECVYPGDRVYLVSPKVLTVVTQLCRHSDCNKKTRAWSDIKELEAHWINDHKYSDKPEDDLAKFLIVKAIVAPAQPSTPGLLQLSDKPRVAGHKDTKFKSGWTVFRNAMRPCAGTADNSTMKRSLLDTGLQSQDVTSTAGFLLNDEGLPLMKYVNATYPDIVTWLGGDRNDRNNLNYHLLGGVIPTEAFQRMTTRQRTAVEGLVKHELLKPEWAGNDGTYAAHLDSLNKAEFFTTLDLPAKTTAGQLVKRGRRIKRLTLAQAELYMKLVRVLGARTSGPSKPRFTIQAPSGSGKTLLCIKTALWHVENQLQLHKMGASPDHSSDRFLLLTHSTTLVTLCVAELEAEASC